MIERTDEMRRAVKSRMGIPDGVELDPWMEAAIGDVLAIAERQVVPEAYGMGRDDEADDAPMAVTLDEINARRGRPW